jgi:hypothetical protein
VQETNAQHRQRERERGTQQLLQPKKHSSNQDVLPEEPENSKNKYKQI